jgi:hypothetical protein
MAQSICQNEIYNFSRRSGEIDPLYQLPQASEKTDE